MLVFLRFETCLKAKSSPPRWRSGEEGYFNGRRLLIQSSSAILLPDLVIMWRNRWTRREQDCEFTPVFGSAHCVTTPIT
jgi:hypothetical protein